MRGRHELGSAAQGQAVQVQDDRDLEALDEAHRLLRQRGEFGDLLVIQHGELVAVLARNERPGAFGGEHHGPGGAVFPDPVEQDPELLDRVAAEPVQVGVAQGIAPLGLVELELHRGDRPAPVQGVEQEPQQR